MSEWNSTTVRYTNPLITESMTEAVQAEVMKTVSQLVFGLKFAPCTVKWRGNWAVQAGDAVRVLDRSGNMHTVLVQSQTITICGGMSASISCPGVVSEDVEFYTSSYVDREISNASSAQKDQILGSVVDGNEVAY